MRVLVTGADKIIGSNLVRVLLDNGFSVRALLDNRLRPPALEDCPIERVHGDVLDMESVQSSLKGIQAVFHCDVFMQYFQPRTDIAWSLNLEGTRNVLIAMVRAGVEDLIYINSATSFGYGLRNKPVTENDKYNFDTFRNPCFDSFKKALDLVQRYNDTGRIRGITLNPTIPMGLYDTRNSAGIALIKRAEHHRGNYSNGSINILNASDAASAIMRAFGRGKNGSCYIIGGHNVDYDIFLRLACRFLGISHPTRQVNDNTYIAMGRAGSLYWKITGREPALSSEAAKIEISHFNYDSSKAVEELDLTTRPVEQIIEEACGWYRKQRHSFNV